MFMHQKFRLCKDLFLPLVLQGQVFPNTSRTSCTKKEVGASCCGKWSRSTLMLSPFLNSATQ
ncbi:hypothetical protein I79_008742 [Cricetulus griseus]|uniref:Uncharacterized protein n=1 Tax=Cricetulus griseus TaxID=10029 RepID=G3HDX4_CRIGR|nr:hypothetical protein I79_008742 [Cricetulus griseus]